MSAKGMYYNESIRRRRLKGMWSNKVLSVVIWLLLLTTVTIASTKQPLKIAELKSPNCECEMLGLDLLAEKLSSDINSIGYVVIYGGRNDTKREEMQIRSARIKRYLTKERGIRAGRLVVIAGGYRENMTVELWIRPQGADAPGVAPTVDAKEVRFLKSKMSRWEEPGCSP
jgi:hypothetical protein